MVDINRTFIATLIAASCMLPESLIIALSVLAAHES